MDATGDALAKLRRLWNETSEEIQRARKERELLLCQIFDAHKQSLYLLRLLESEKAVKNFVSIFSDEVNSMLECIFNTIELNRHQLDDPEPSRLMFNWSPHPQSKILKEWRLGYSLEPQSSISEIVRRPGFLIAVRLDDYPSNLPPQERGGLHRTSFVDKKRKLDALNESAGILILWDMNQVEFVHGPNYSRIGHVRGMTHSKVSFEFLGPRWERTTLDMHRFIHELEYGELRKNLNQSESPSRKPEKFSREQIPSKKILDRCVFLYNPPSQQTHGKKVYDLIDSINPHDRWSNRSIHLVPPKRFSMRKNHHDFKKASDEFNKASDEFNKASDEVNSFDLLEQFFNTFKKLQRSVTNNPHLNEMFDINEHRRSAHTKKIWGNDLSLQFGLTYSPDGLVHVIETQRKEQDDVSSEWVLEHLDKVVYFANFTGEREILTICVDKFSAMKWSLHVWRLMPTMEFKQTIETELNGTELGRFLASGGCTAGSNRNLNRHKKPLAMVLLSNDAEYRIIDRDLKEISFRFVSDQIEVIGRRLRDGRGIDFFSEQPHHSNVPLWGRYLWTTVGWLDLDQLILLDSVEPIFRSNLPDRGLLDKLIAGVNQELKKIEGFPYFVRHRLTSKGWRFSLEK